MARKNEPDGFVFDVDAFESDGVVEAMSTEQVGAYIRLLCKAWREKPPGTIPDDDEVLARWARLTPKQWIAARDRVLRAFSFSDDDKRWHQKRMKETYAALMERHDRLSASGKIAAKTRWRNNAVDMRDAYGTHCETDAEYHAKVMPKNANQNQNQNQKSILNNQAKDLPYQETHFDLKTFAPEDWHREYSEVIRVVGETTEDTRFVAQVAWLVCAGSPIVGPLRNAMDGMKLLASDGKPPKRPVAYLRGCLESAVSKPGLAELLAKAPPRQACSEVVEASV